MGLVKQDLYLFVFPDVGSVLQVYLVPWVCYVFSGRCHHKPVAPAAAAPVVSASELLELRNPPVNGRSVFSRDKGFFFCVFPKRKHLAQVRGVGTWCIYRNALGGEADTLVLIGKCRQEPTQSRAGRGQLHVVTLVSCTETQK